MAKRLLPLLVIAALAGGGYYWYTHLPPHRSCSPASWTTNDVVVSSQGRRADRRAQGR
jgi:hypothetical protein